MLEDELNQTMQAGGNPGRRENGFIELESIDKPRVAGSEGPNDRKGQIEYYYNND